MKKGKTENIRGAPFVRKEPHLVTCLPPSLKLRRTGRPGSCKRGNPTNSNAPH